MKCMAPSRRLRGIRVLSPVTLGCNTTGARVGRNMALSGGARPKILSTVRQNGVNISTYVLSNLCRLYSIIAVSTISATRQILTLSPSHRRFFHPTSNYLCPNRAGLIATAAYCRREFGRTQLQWARRVTATFSRAVSAIRAESFSVPKAWHRRCQLKLTIAFCRCTNDPRCRIVFFAPGQHENCTYPSQRHTHCG